MVVPGRNSARPCLIEGRTVRVVGLDCSEGQDVSRKNSEVRSTFGKATFRQQAFCCGDKLLGTGDVFGREVNDPV